MSTFNKEDINQKFSVLYVEDQLDIQETFTELLSMFVDEVIVASNGAEGLEKYREQLPDFIISDIQMPVMTGLEMIAEIRKIDPDIPVIITTAFDESHYLLDAIGLGVEHYLLKPIMLESLRSKLTKVKNLLMQQRELDAYHLYLEERVAIEVAARESKEALLLTQNRNAEVGQMVSIIAHQWKQPLHYFNFLIDDLNFEFSKNRLTKESMDEFVEKGTQRIAFLTETMESFLRFYKTTTKVKTFTIDSVIKDIVFFLFEPFKSLGIVLEIEVEEDFTLKGIENELQQVILNLVNNAKEAFEEMNKREGKILIHVTQKDGFGILQVSDNAGGIAENILGKIFDMEYTTKESGNGIGLYLVKKIVKQRLNGTIEVANNSGGACFTMKFNISKES